jgi:hypothetical protein
LDAALSLQDIGGKGEERRLPPYIMGGMPEVFPLYYYAVVKSVFWEMCGDASQHHTCCFGVLRSSHKDVFGGFWIISWIGRGVVFGREEEKRRATLECDGALRRGEAEGRHHAPFL